MLTCLFIYLVFVQLTVLVLLLALTLKRDDHKTHKDVHHEEGNDDDKHKIEDGHQGAIAMYRTLVLIMRINGLVHHSEKVRSHQLLQHKEKLGVNILNIKMKVEGFVLFTLTK